MPLVSISGGAFRTRGTLRHEVGWDCEGGEGGRGGCRRKRSASEGGPEGHADLTLHLSTEEAVLSGAEPQVKIRLRRSPPLLSPDYRLVVRGGSGGASLVNRTVPFPSCLYTGEVEGTGATVAVSTCQDNKLVIATDVFFVRDSVR